MCLLEEEVILTRLMGPSGSSTYAASLIINHVEDQVWVTDRLITFTFWTFAANLFSDPFVSCRDTSIDLQEIVI